MVHFVWECMDWPRKKILFRSHLISTVRQLTTHYDVSIAFIFPSAGEAPAWSLALNSHTNSQTQGDLSEILCIISEMKQRLSCFPFMKSKAVTGPNDPGMEVFWRYNHSPLLSHLVIISQVDLSFAVFEFNVASCWTLCEHCSWKAHCRVWGDSSIHTVLPAEACKLTPASGQRKARWRAIITEDRRQKHPWGHWQTNLA